MLRYTEQKDVFRLIPGLENADFMRFGSIHRNAYLNAPLVLNPDLSLRSNPDVFVAGQLSGVEGYVECIASGLICALIAQDKLPILPAETILGQLWRRLITPEKQQFQPVNANFGILPPLVNEPRDKKLKRTLLSERSLAALKDFLSI
jgi:methylenetetrahydrofolate--tRNA-(uracil-5-)-methyltransferase